MDATASNEIFRRVKTQTRFFAYEIQKLYFSNVVVQFRVVINANIQACTGATRVILENPKFIWGMCFGFHQTFMCVSTQKSSLPKYD